MAEMDREERVIELLQNDTLETLELNYDDLRVITAYALCMQLRTKPNITSLCLDNLSVGYYGMKMLVDELAVNTTVRCLSLQRMSAHPPRSICVHPWNSFLMSLSKCQSLTTLNLCSTGVFRNAVDGMCVLLRNARLENLSLDNWCDKFNEALLDNTSLRQLNLCSSRFVSLSDILPALINPRCTLQSFSIGCRECDEESLKKLAEYYKAPATYCLQELNLQSIRTTMADDEFVEMWIDVMHANPSLAVLTSHGSHHTKEISDLLAQEQRQMQTEMPKAALVAVVRARIE